MGPQQSPMNARSLTPICLRVCFEDTGEPGGNLHENGEITQARIKWNETAMQRILPPCSEMSLRTPRTQGTGGIRTLTHGGPRQTC